MIFLKILNIIFYFRSNPAAQDAGKTYDNSDNPISRALDESFVKIEDLSEKPGEQFGDNTGAVARDEDQSSSNDTFDKHEDTGMLIHVD